MTESFPKHLRAVFESLRRSFYLLYGSRSFVLARIALLALNVAISRLGQHRRGPRKRSVPSIDLVRRGARDHKERNPVPHFRSPAGLLVESRLDRCLRWIIPNQPVALVRHQERHATAGTARRSVVLPAVNRVPAMIEESPMVLSQPVVVLVVWRSKCRSNNIELRVGRTAIAGQVGRPFLLIGHPLRPTGHLQQLLSFRCPQRNVAARRGPVEVLWNV